MIVPTIKPTKLVNYAYEGEKPHTPALQNTCSKRKLASLWPSILVDYIYV